MEAKGDSFLTSLGFLLPPQAPFLSCASLSLLLHALTLSLYFYVFENEGEDGSTTHNYPGDTHANLSRLKANLSWLIRKSAGN